MDIKTSINVNTKSSMAKTPSSNTRTVFLVSRLFFILIMFASRNSLLNIINLFDAEHYINIASFGYYDWSITAFFPVLPIIIKFTSIWGALIINNLCFYASLYILSRMNIPQEILYCLALSPIGFFSTLLYTEGIFFFLTTFALYLYKEKKYPILMGIVIGLSVCTRNTGSLLFFSIFIGMCIDWINKKSSFKNIVITYIPATLLSIIFPAFLQFKFGNWKIFVDSQYSVWIKIKSNIFTTVIYSFQMLFTDKFPFEDEESRILFRINESLSLILIFFIIALIVMQVVKLIKIREIDSLEIVFILYSLACLLACCSTIRDPFLDAPTTSFYRYLYGIAPVFMMSAKMRPLSRRILLYITIVISLVTSYTFSRGIFFY